jgi:hypothetical protein
MGEPRSATVWHKDMPGGAVDNMDWRSQLFEE